MKQLILLTLLSAFLSTSTTAQTYLAAGGVHKPAIAYYHDQNGDGYREKVVISGESAQVFIGHANGSFHRAAIRTQFTQSGVYRGYTRQLKDVNGDGIGDVVFKGEAGKFVYLGKKDGRFHKARREG